MNLLATILDDKRREIEAARANAPISRLQKEAELQTAPRPFKESLRDVPFALIAEVKKASPSKGILVQDFDHRRIAKDYESGGAQALSVLTDEKFFMGHPAFIKQVKENVGLPVLRKDFVIDPYQIYESRALGADAILLIVAALSPRKLNDLYVNAKSLGMAVLVETHTKQEIEIANSIGAEIIGVNNRDLSTFSVRLESSLELHSFIHGDAVTVSESGIRTRKDVLALKQAGYQAALVGEGLVTGPDRAAAVRMLLQS